MGVPALQDTWGGQLDVAQVRARLYLQKLLPKFGRVTTIVTRLCGEAAPRLRPGREEEWADEEDGLCSEQSL